MLTVYIVDQKTRIILPSSQWGFNVREKLTQMGHKVEAYPQKPHECVRDEAEMQRMDELLTSTGL